MIVAPGTKLLVCHRRLFAEDQPRLFAGTVLECEADLVKITGFSWTRDPSHGYQRKADKRTKIIPLGSGSVIVYELPAEIQVEDLAVEQPGGHTVVLSDGHKFRMDLSERLTHAAH